MKKSFLRNLFTQYSDEIVSKFMRDFYRSSSSISTGLYVGLSGIAVVLAELGFINEAKSKIEKKLKLPPGYFIEWGGNFKNLQRAKQRLYIIVPFCLALVFFIIYTAFGKVWQTVLLFSTVPMAIAGGTINLNIMGLPFSISAAIGFIALSGISILHSLICCTDF